MNNTKKISVIMSVFNTKEEWLRHAIESIQKQTYKNIEFVIILDKPTDNSENIVNEYAENDNRIVVIKNEINLGLTKSLNIGIKKSTGEYIARMDSDDISHVKRFEKQVQYLENHPETVVLGTLTRAFDEKKNNFIGMNNNSCNNDINKIRMIFCNAGVAHSTAMIRKDFLEKNNILYDEDIKKAQDYALWTDIVLSNGKIDVIKEILLDYRIHENQITQKYSKEQIECIKKIMKKQLKYYFEFEPTNEELEINFNLFRDYSQTNSYNVQKYINKLFANNKKLNQKLLKMEIYSIILNGIISRLFKNNEWSYVFSKTTLKALNIKNLCYTISKKIDDKKYKKML